MTIKKLDNKWCEKELAKQINEVHEKKREKIEVNVGNKFITFVTKHEPNQKIVSTYQADKQNMNKHVCMKNVFPDSLAPLDSFWPQCIFAESLLETQSP